MKTRIRALLACAFLAACSGAFAQESVIRKTLEEKLGSKIDSVTKTSYNNLYEVYTEGQILYTDEKATFIIGAMTRGEIFDVNGKKSLTGERLSKLNAIKFADLPLDNAVKIVRGKGTRVFATFEDPNCGYCKRFAKDLQNLDDITVYVFVYPILSADSTEKAKQIWCAPDRAKAWTDWMTNGTAPTGDGKCDAPTDKVVALGEKLRVNGTPTIFFSNGERVGGAIPAAQVDKRLNQIAKSK